LNHINAKLQLLNNRIATAKIVDLNNQMMKYDAGLKIIGKTELQQYQIVGVDDDISKGKSRSFHNCQNIDKQKLERKY
jgi:transcription elongation factor GreB